MASSEEDLETLPYDCSRRNLEGRGRLSEPPCALRPLPTSPVLPFLSSYSCHLASGALPRKGLGKHMDMASQEDRMMQRESVGAFGVTEAGGTLGESFLPRGLRTLGKKFVSSEPRTSSLQQLA
ncbi:unnamed protein product [Rangifer tarandus platyrhynchus]|uniref:Uncharacterized protein n=1 Tax=Rangifer tarandus platyrhynchus TaxID=3082113 RepID=A0ABN8YF56_RANTA|nr:unnamed protein product [Rangifer tarandus platyrhynchus]